MEGGSCEVGSGGQRRCRRDWERSHSSDKAFVVTASIHLDLGQEKQQQGGGNTCL